MSAEGGSLFPATLRKAFSRSFLGPVEVGSLVPRSEVPKSLLLPTSKLTSSEGPQRQVDRRKSRAFLLALPLKYAKNSTFPPLSIRATLRGPTRPLLSPALL